MRTRVMWTLFGVVLLVSSSASGQAIDRRATGLASPDQTITFSEISCPDGTPATNQWAGFGIIFSPGLYCGSVGYGGSPFPTPAIYNFPAAITPFTPVFSIFFSSLMQGAAVNFVTNGGTTLFEALLAGIPVASFLGTTNGDTTPWFGFENLVFDELRFTPGGHNNAMGLDNLQMSAVTTVTPEPATLGLLATGLVGLAGAGWVRRRKG